MKFSEESFLYSAQLQFNRITFKYLTNNTLHHHLEVKSRSCLQYPVNIIQMYKCRPLLAVILGPIVLTVYNNFNYIFVTANWKNYIYTVAKLWPSCGLATLIMLFI